MHILVNGIRHVIMNCLDNKIRDNVVLFAKIR